MWVETSDSEEQLAAAATARTRQQLTDDAHLCWGKRGRCNKAPSHSFHRLKFPLRPLTRDFTSARLDPPPFWNSQSTNGCISPQLLSKVDVFLA
ncbi:hypothetical protein CEXT_453241 [Caerostris extrusa]|uniref:Uncharacterized protein n=1 Tax=Caerostris extrusa TaxID=172846 RepID=A0AAV4MPB7_CAEEX|nr:hypothetical protein CEXT_453241 [Caerostris extrusa]